MRGPPRIPRVVVGEGVKRGNTCTPGMLPGGFCLVLSPAPLATATAKRHLWVTGSEAARGEAVHGRGT